MVTESYKNRLLERTKVGFGAGESHKNYLFECTKADSGAIFRESQKSSV
jgi:hypothetical protein